MTPAEFIAKWRASPKREHIDSQPPLPRPLPPPRRRGPRHRRPRPRLVHLREGRHQIHRRPGLGRRLAQGLLRLGIQELRPPARPRLRPAPPLRRRAGEPAAPHRLRHGPHPRPHQLDQHRPGDPHPRPRRPPRRHQARPPESRLHRPRPPEAEEDPRRPHRRSRREILHPRAPPPRARPRPRDRRPLRQPPRLLHVRRGRRPPPRPPLPAHAGSLPPRPADFAAHAATLFAAMQAGGRVGFTPVDWFNGGLFDDAAALPVDRADIDQLLEAARLDWSQIDPSILGTLFERGLDPAKRSQLGAHYTDRDKIMKIVNPSSSTPSSPNGPRPGRRSSSPRPREGRRLPRRRHAPPQQALELRSAFLERLKAFRVLDPACGSGNFLYLALRALKDIEHRVNFESEALGLPRTSRSRPRGRPRHRAQPLRRRARPRLGLDRRDPVDASNGFDASPQTPSSAPSTPSNAATPS